VSILLSGMQWVGAAALFCSIGSILWAVFAHQGVLPCINMSEVPALLMLSAGGCC
jgi:hypothetical protein